MEERETASDQHSHGYSVLWGDSSHSGAPDVPYSLLQGFIRDLDAAFGEQDPEAACSVESELGPWIRRTAFYGCAQPRPGCADVSQPVPIP